MLNMMGKEERNTSDQFINTFNNTLSNDECDAIIELFENDSRKTSPEHNSTVKVSTDVNAQFGEDEFKMYNDIIYPKLCQAKEQYVQLNPVLNEYYTSPWSLTRLYRIQRYLDGEGYHGSHCEHGPHTPPLIMTWTIYLNDSPCGTKYINQDLIVPAVKGSCCIAPAFWTHTHHGITPNIGTKYITTGWFQYI